MAVAPTATEVATEERVRSFERNGFISFKDMLTADEVADFLRGVKELETDAARGGHVYRESEQYIQHVNVWRAHDVIRRHVFNRRLAEIASRLSRSRRVRLWHDQAIIKMPGGRPTAWHQDVPAWPMIDAATFTCWVALVDATEEGGCLRYIPGSHRWGRLAHHTLPRDMLESLDGLRLLVPEDKVDQLRPVSMVLKAGSVTFHSSLTLHAAHPNRTAGPRYGFIINYMPEGVRFSGRPHVVTKDLDLAVYQPITGELFPILASEDPEEVAPP